MYHCFLDYGCIPGILIPQEVTGENSGLPEWNISAGTFYKSNSLGIIIGAHDPDATMGVSLTEALRLGPNAVRYSRAADANHECILDLLTGRKIKFVLKVVYIFLRLHTSMSYASCY